MHLCFFFFFKQKTAYEMRISDWSSDVCSSDLESIVGSGQRFHDRLKVITGFIDKCVDLLEALHHLFGCLAESRPHAVSDALNRGRYLAGIHPVCRTERIVVWAEHIPKKLFFEHLIAVPPDQAPARLGVNLHVRRSEEHTSELQSLILSSYAVFSL